MSLWDRLLLAVAPRAALRNEAARTAVGQMRGMSRRGKRYGGGDPDWARNTGRLEDALPVQVINQRRIRRLLQTNPYAVKVRQTLLNNLVGFGITGTPGKGAPKKLTEAWQRWLRKADWMGRLDFYGLQDLAVGEMISGGESFILRRFDKNADGVVPTRIEVLDADMLAAGPTGQPIEYDKAGRPVSYTFRAQRHSQNGAISLETVTFVARDVIHLFRQDQPGQARGRSVFEPVVKRFEDLEGFIEAEVVRKGIEACFAAFITPSEDHAAETTDVGAESDELSWNDFDVELLEPGQINRLRPGDQVTFGDPKPSAGIKEFARVALLGATTGAGVPYEHGTGDLSNVNYSSYRAGSLEFQRFCGRLQWLLIIPVALERIWDWFCEDAYQTGMIGKRWYQMDWAPPAFESIDRAKDVKADIMEMGAGLTSRRRLVAARGFHLEDVVTEIAEDQALTEGLGLQFQGDPRTGLNAAVPDGPADSETDQTKKASTDDGSRT